MPVFRLSDELIFPPVYLAEGEGVLAVGGDLSPKRLLLAYSQGIFPWYSQGDPIVWWSPDPRMVLYPNELKIHRSMRPVLNQQKFSITYDQDFPAVIAACKKTYRKGQGGTWITPEMQAAYIRLHELGYAHSVEAWQGDQLAGGLYGISLGRCFFGESMFSAVANASKAAFITLVRALRDRHFSLVDCQVYTTHLESLGAVEIRREDFIRQLEAGMAHSTLKGSWADWD